VVNLERNQKWNQEHPEIIEDNGKVSFLPGDFFKEVNALNQDIYYVRFFFKSHSTFTLLR
jgi:hypothetical protein